MNPNHTSQPNRASMEQLKKDQIGEFYSFMKVDEVADLRDAQHRVLKAKRKGVKSHDPAALQQAEQAAYAEFANLRKMHLNRAGVFEDPTGQRTDFQEFNKVLEEYSIDKMDDIEWVLGEPDPATGKLVSGREKLENNFEHFVNDMSDTVPDSVNEIKPTQELLDARSQLEKLRDELASLSAKRMGRLLSRKKTKQEFERLQQEYHDKLIEVGQKEEELREQNNPPRTDDEKRFDVMMDLLSNEKELRELVNHKLEGSKLDKLAHWLNDGGKWKKILKGAAVAVPLGLVTGGAGVVIAAVITGVGLVSASAGTVTAVAVVGGGGKLLLNFIRRNTDRRIGVNEADSQTATSALGNIEDVDTKTHAEIQNEVVTKRGAELQAEVKEQQKRRRRTLGKAAVVTALTIGLSTGVSTALQSFFDQAAPGFQEKDYGGKSGQTSNGSGHEYGQNKTKFGSGGSNGSAGGEAANGGAEVHPHPDHDPKYEEGSENHPHPDHDPQHVDEEAASPTETSPVEYNAEAQEVHAGEGLYSVFDQMGIAKADQPALLQKVGPQLATLDNGSGKPFAYLINGEPGNWGIRATPALDNKMPTGTLDMINQAHQEMIGTQQISEAAPSSIVKMDVITPEEVANNDTLNKLANVDVNSGTIEDGRAYAEVLGFNPDAWDMVQHQMVEDYPGSFVELPGGRVGIKEGLLPDEVAADLFNRLENVNLPSGDSIKALEVIEPGDINKSILDRFSIIPEFTDSAEEFLRENGFGHAWLEINKPEIASEIAKAAPSAFTFENGTLGIIPNGRISDEAWAIIANHMNAIERARVGIG